MYNYADVLVALRMYNYADVGCTLKMYNYSDVFVKLWWVPRRCTIVLDVLVKL